ncbi:methyltransferase domain-containing protein [Clostridium boliviensis]|uniref:Methyltransferase domain-containing protein n=1 Tax=Clostridium boliviensis TaxID=318465 RepID=A0ABU4GJC9_9CLOT|nr:methyltransferase domain-containing protein [Clostridium boliviensis]MDW2797714.1 methyltransferase domain-containing protein [Clostridium boliviensis]
MKIMIAELRKNKGISQQELADVMGVAYQTVSKWETNVTFPDITLLPQLAQYFDVSVDELLGLKPLPSLTYIPSESGMKGYWSERLEYLKRTRDSLWNKDYLQFLIEKVWKINNPVNILDCGCGYGFLSSMLMPLMPEGSTYTGVDFSENLINEGREALGSVNNHIRFICDNVLTYESDLKYDFVITQAVLRHIDNPQLFLEKMISFTKKGGCLVCVEVNRELENAGLYIEGMDYDYLCENPGFRKMWSTELERQGRDYSIGMKIPHMMRQLGVKDIDIRMSDKVSFISPESYNYNEKMTDFIQAQEFYEHKTDAWRTRAIDRFMNHGMDRKDAEHYCNKQNNITDYIYHNRETLAYTHLYGLLISFGTI